MTQITIPLAQADQPKPEMRQNLRDPGSFYRPLTVTAHCARSLGRPPSP